MYKLTVLTIALSITLNISAQKNTTTERKLNPQDYSQKSTRQKRTGNILLITGAGLVVAGAVIPRGDLIESSGICVDGSYLCSKTYENTGIKTGIIVGGVASALASIPFYIAAKKNRKRAALVRLNVEGTNHVVNRSFGALQLAVIF